MAIDPRILQSIGVRDNTQVLNMFQNALNQQQNREAQQQQLAIQQEQAPFRQQLLEQQVAANQQAQQVSNENRVIKSVSDFSPVLMPELQNALESGDTSGVQSLLTNRIAQLKDRGIPTRETEEALLAVQSGDIQSVINDVNVINQEALSRNLTGRKAIQATASQRDFKTFQELQAKAEETGSAADAQAVDQFGRQAGFSRPTEQEKADIKVSETERKEVAKANAQRKQGFIDAGVEAADSVGNLKRTIELLDSVKTGGFDNAALRAKQLFGVEGGDEGELSANLGVAVLSQLKPIFGAAFTAAEGERLERISARFGASPDTNKRLLNSALKIAERAANRGIAAAEDQGDEFTANEIKNSLATIVEEPKPELTPAQSLQPQEQQQTQFTEGQTATGPNGEIAIFTNGQWVVQNG